MLDDARQVAWKVDRLRKEISDDWKKLASKSLTADKRMAVREHLEMSASALKELVSRHQTAVQKLKLNRFKQMQQLEFKLSSSNDENKTLKR